MPGRGKGPLRIAFEDWFLTFFQEWVLEAIQDYAKRTGDPAAKAMSAGLTLANLGEEGDYASFLDEVIEGVEDPIPQALMKIISLTTIFKLISSSTAEPASRPIMAAAERKYKSRRFDPETATLVGWRNPNVKDTMLEHIRDQGFPDDLIIAYQNLLKRRTPEEVLLTRWLRGDIPEDKLDVELTRRGWDLEAITNLKEVREIIPGIHDLITMAVREAWRDDVAAAFGYDQDFPDEAAEWAEKQGLSREWTQRYWRAHWDLPGPRDGFEMFQRLRPGRTDTPFTEADLSKLLRALDIPPKFRGWLTQIAYRTLSRVDVRRMYRVGTLDRQGVLDNYLDLGYSPKNAELMTDFTIRYETEEPKEATRSAIQTGYEVGLLRRDEAASYLQSLGYTSDIAEFWLDLVDWDLAQDQQKDKLDYIETRYLNGVIDEAELMGELGTLDMPSDRMQQIYEQLYIKKRNKIKLPSKTELDRWMKYDIIDETHFVDAHLALGYRREDAERYLEESLIEMQEAAVKEVQDTQKEQERIREARLSSYYQITTAEINQEIAQVKLAIADIKLALLEIEDPKQVSQLQARELEMKRYIAALRAAKAGEKLEYEELTAPEEG